MSTFVRRFSAGLCVTAFFASHALALDPMRSIAEMNHRVFTQDDGLPNHVNSIAQTPDGYLWLGTGSGLFRFDGVHFDRVGAGRLLSSNVTAVAATPNGDLWIGYLNGGMSRMRDGAVANYAPSAGGPSDAIGGIAIAPHGGGVWVNANFLPWRFNGHRWVRIPGDWNGTENAVWVLWGARDGAVWGKNGTSAFYCRPGCKRFVTARGYAGGVMGFAHDSSGRIWTSDARAPGHMYAFPDIVGLADKAIPGPVYGAQISNLVRGNIFLDRDGTLWNNDARYGLVRVRSIFANGAGAQDADVYTPRDGLSSSHIVKLYEDHEGDIWAATLAGLDCFRPANAVVEKRIPASPVWGYSAVRSGAAIYVAGAVGADNGTPLPANGGVIYRIGADGAPRVAVPALDHVSIMAAGRNGDVWIGTPRGLFHLQDDKLTSEAMPKGFEGASVDGLAEDPDGRLWMTIENSGVFRREREVWTRIPVRTDRPDARPTSATVDNQGAFWAFYDEDRMLVRYAHGRAQEFSVTSDPDIGLVKVIYPDHKGVLIGGELGIARYDGRGFHVLSSETAPALALTSGIVELDGQTWIASPAGIAHFNSAALENAIAQRGAPLPSYQVFDRRDGLPGGIEQDNNFNIALSGPDGRAWFITDHGMIWIDPRRIFHNALPPPVAIRSIAAGGQIFAAPRNLTLDAGTSSLEIDYTALSFVEPSRVQFRYRLDGVDADWVNPGQRRQAFYTKLGPGRYNFHVIASNDNGVWNNNGASFAFVIPPTFVQSDWFTALCALGSLAFLWLLYSLRHRQLAAQFRTLLQERLNERERIARELHDTLLQGVDGLILRFQSIANGMKPDEPARRQMDEVLERADDVLSESRDRMRDLRPAHANRSLSDIFVSAGENRNPAGNLRFRVITEGTPHELHPIVRDEIARIGCEAISNAFRHARADNIDVLVVYAASRLSVTIADDGAGIASSVIESGREGHFGLTGMRERARRIKAEFSVASREGAGTSVNLTIPARLAYAVHAKTARWRWPWQPAIGDS